MSYYKPLEYIVPPEDDGILLRTVLQNRLGVSRKLLSRLKQTEQGITLNGERRYLTIRVQTGDRVAVLMEAEASDDILPQPMPLAVLYEDDELLVLNKEAGRIVHPTHGHYTDTIANGVVYHWQQRGETVRFRPIHRLDQETSGALAIAKNPYVHQQISEEMQTRGLKKEYLALVHGHMTVHEGTVDAPIDRDQENPHVRIVTEQGYRAVTHFRVERHLRGATLVRLWLETGRTHQIRVHMRHLGHPLLGDKMYGWDVRPRQPWERQLSAVSSAESPSVGAMSAGEMKPGQPLLLDAGVPASPAPEAVRLEEAAAQLGRHALHACLLGLTHPVRREWMEFEAPLPDDLRACLAALEPGQEET